MLNKKILTGCACAALLGLSTFGTAQAQVSSEPVAWNAQWQYADSSAIHDGQAVLYHTDSAVKKNKTVCVNAGHGTSGGEEEQVLCHPDGTPKYVSGSTAAGSVYATAVASGTTMADGTPEAEVNLAMARVVKELLLAEGYDVLMVRDGDDVQLDNIARTVLANQKADCHIAIHYDSTTSDKGAFCIVVPDIEAYKEMEPVKSYWQQHDRLAECLLDGLRAGGVELWGDGLLELDLTQTSYSLVPSVDMEVGDRASDYSEQELRRIARGIVAGVNRFFS